MAAAPSLILRRFVLFSIAAKDEELRRVLGSRPHVIGKGHHRLPLHFLLECQGTEVICIESLKMKAVVINDVNLAH
ncbi:unnamed protein product [Coffea canephora]|uniref:DH200=94 genomic scaffold, scaffold_200 n=1 Tax=Coffea canephora TaxID=49390 RepID=A0A068VBE7_COFCA|nr:unnamed protein product [Coffea canephora]